MTSGKGTIGQGGQQGHAPVRGMILYVADLDISLREDADLMVAANQFDLSVAIRGLVMIRKLDLVALASRVHDKLLVEIE